MKDPAPRSQEGEGAARNSRITEIARQVLAGRETLSNFRPQDAADDFLVIEKPRSFFEAAERELRGRYALSPDSPEEMVALARLWCVLLQLPQTWARTKQLTADAEMLFSRAIEIDGGDSHALIGRAQLLENRTRWLEKEQAGPLLDLAGEYCGRALEKDESSSHGWTIRGLVERRRGQFADSRESALAHYQSALEHFDRARAIRHDYYPAFFATGILLLDRAREIDGPKASFTVLEAITNFNAALAIHPQHPPSMIGFGDAVRLHARYVSSRSQAYTRIEETIESYENALKANEYSFDALNSWGNALMNQARLRSGPEANRLCVLAIEKYQAAILLNEENQTPLANLGITAYFQADNTASPDTAAHLQRAQECLRKALQLRPGYAWARVQLASVLRFRARFEGTERALAAISEGIEQCQLALGRRVDYEYAISVGSQLLRAKAEYSSRSERLSILKQAAEMAEAGRRIWPTHEGLLLNLGEALVAQAWEESWGQSEVLLEQAHTVFQDATRIWTQSEDSLRSAARASGFLAQRALPLSAGIRYDEAYEKFAAALEIRPDSYQTLAEWGMTLRNHSAQASGRRTALLAEAEAKLRQAVALKPDYFWGTRLLSQVLESMALDVPGASREPLLAEASGLLVKHLALVPHDRVALCGLANVHILTAARTPPAAAKRRLNEADNCCAAALRIQPDDSWAMELRARVLYENARLETGAEAERLYGLAQERFESAVQAHPNIPWRFNSQARALAGQAAQSKGERIRELYEQADGVFKKSLQIRADHVPTIVDRANALSSAANLLRETEETGGRFSEAVRMFELAEELDPMNCDLMRDWAAAWANRGRVLPESEALPAYKQALRLLDSSLSLGARREIILLERATFAINRARQANNEAERLIQGAVVDLREAVRLAPLFDQALYKLGLTLHYDTGGANLEEALIWYERANEAAPFRRDVLSDWARLLLRLQRYEEAAAKARIGLELFDSVDIRRLLASILKSQAGATSGVLEAGRILEQAEESLRVALRIAPDNAELHSELGQVLMRRGDKVDDHQLRSQLFDRAIAELGKAIEIDAKSSFFLSNRARLYSHRALLEPNGAGGLLEAAIADIESALQIQPKDKDLERQRDGLLEQTRGLKPTEPA